MNEQLIRQAVLHDQRPAKQRLLQRLFAVWFEGLVYNQVWEDPTVDIEALKIGPESRMLVISSGGCNALNYLLADPASITAVDLNRGHSCLLDLKRAAIGHLPEFDDFFELFGIGKSQRADALYRRWLASDLDPQTREYWETSSMFDGMSLGPRISCFRERGLYDHSRSALFLRFFHWLSRRFGLRIEAVLDADTLEEQSVIFEEQIAPFFDNPLIELVGRLPLTMFGLGIPPQQFDVLKNDTGEGRTIIQLFRERIRRLACDHPIKENYFAWQAFARRYDTVDHRAIPEYLKEENYARLKANIDRLSIANISIQTAIESFPQNSFDRFVLLDAMDWMNADQLTGLWQLIAAKSCPSSRLIFRTAGTLSPVETALPSAVKKMFRYEKDISKRLFEKDRSSIYGGFHLYILDALKS